jgi:hypothetical protein
MENIIKKESKVTYKKFLNSKKGDLVLTNSRLYFTSKDTEIFNTAIKDIINVKAQNGLGNGMSHLVVTYTQDGKEQTAKIEHFSFLKGVAIGNLSALKEPYFKSWELAIEDLRSGKNTNNNMAELEKLAELKSKGVITEQEFSAKKKQLLGL